MATTIHCLVDLGLVVYLIWECARAPGRYRALKEELARGDRTARWRMYAETIRFELVSAALAGASLLLGEAHPLARAAQALARAGVASRLRILAEQPSALAGAGAGLLAASLIVVAARKLQLRFGRRAAPARASTPSPRRRLMPDFGALLPVTPRERALFALVALSAGVCEELVFRGWLLAALHGLGLDGAALLWAGALGFGLCHAYQGPIGILATGYLGAGLAALFGATGSLLLPMVIHTVIDLRWAFWPAARAAEPAARPAEPAARPAEPAPADSRAPAV